MIPLKRSALFLFLSIYPLRAGFSADPTPLSSESEAAIESVRAPVMLDGETLFFVRGASSYPAPLRAHGISERLRAVAADPNIPTDSIEAIEKPEFIIMQAGPVLLFRVFDADASFDKIPRATQADIYRQKMMEAITGYRHRRTPQVLLLNSLVAIGYSVAALLILWVVRRIFIGLGRLVDRRFKTTLEILQSQSHQILQAKPFHAAIQGMLQGLRFLCFVMIGLIWLNLTLGCFPRTRAISLRVFSIFLSPLEQMGNSIIESLPNLAFLLVLVWVTRFLLKLIRLYFIGLDRGRIHLENFDPDWAMPTYKIVRLLILSFTAVIAYPYIPGSSSNAFKGVSLFLGVVFSLGSSSVIANMIAGYSLTYRRAFKLGDMIRVGNVRGSVVDSGLMVTRVRTPKNEDVIVPNVKILNEEVTNFSSMARTGELILHTTVGIGYETSWRQVEAMLLLAAERTPDILRKPGPFVRLLSLGEFAVTYELNACSEDASKMIWHYSLLHQNILDVFNEFNVQIMTPAYEGDPEAPKIVPKDKWFAAPSPHAKDGPSRGPKK